MSPAGKPAAKAAGYSGTPLPKKLGIKDGHRVALVDLTAPPFGGTAGRGQAPTSVAPAGFAASLAWPPGAHVVAGLAGREPFDVIVVFATRRAAIAKRLAALRARMAPAAGLWLAWPKQASGVATDLADHVLRELALPTGLVDNKVCAIDATWSGLRFVIRVALRG